MKGSDRSMLIFKRGYVILKNIALRCAYQIIYSISFQNTWDSFNSKFYLHMLNKRGSYRVQPRNRVGVDYMQMLSITITITLKFHDY